MAWEKKESHGTFIRGSEERKDQYRINITPTSHQHQSTTSNLHLQHIRCSIFNMWTTFPLPPDALSCNQILTLLSSITMTLPTPSLRTYMHTTYTHTSTHPHIHTKAHACDRMSYLPDRHNPHRTSTSTSYIPRVPTSKATQYARYALSLFIRQKVPSHLLHDPFHAIIIHQTDRDRHPTFKRNAYSRVEMNIKQMIFRGTCYIEYIMSDPFNSNFFILRSPSPLEKRFISDQTSRNRFPIALKSNASAINK